MNSPKIKHLVNRGNREIQQAKQNLQNQFKLLEATRIQLETSKQTLGQQNSTLQEGRKKLAEAEKQFESQKEKGLPQTALICYARKNSSTKTRIGCGNYCL